MMQPGSYPPQGQPRKPGWWRRKSKGKKALWVIGGVVILLVVMIAATTAGGGSGNSASSTTASIASATTEPESVTSTSEEASQATATTAKQSGGTSTTGAIDSTSEVSTTEATPASQTYSDGTYLVGTDIPAGLYKGSVSSGPGYWQISSDTNGDNIISNADPTGQFYVSVKAGQYLTLGSVTIQKADTKSPGDMRKSDISDGTYLVGYDIAAGRYKGTVSGDMGYWEISSDANGDKIVSNADPTGQFYVTVKAGQYLTLTNVTISQ